MKVKKYCLGAGISGLIFKYYNPSYKIISPDVGGQLSATPQVQFVFFIHKHRETEILFDSLGIAYTQRRLNIYFYRKGKVFAAISPQLRRKFVQNKLTEVYDDNPSFETPDTTLSTQSNYLDILEIKDMGELIEKLSDGVEIIKAQVKLINNNKKFLLLLNDKGEFERMNYDKIVSTIPANKFFDILYTHTAKKAFNYLPCTYVMSKTKPDWVTSEGMYYVDDASILYNRVTFYDDRVIYDVTGIVLRNEIKKYIKDIDAIETRYVGILQSNSVADFRSIKFIGRGACWDHRLKIQDSVVKAMEIAENEK